MTTGSRLAGIPTISFDDKNLYVDTPDGGRCQIGWDEVYIVSAYKIDVPKHQVLFLTFDWDFGDGIEVCEGMEGFAPLLDNLDQHLKIPIAEWRAKLEASATDDPPLVLFRR